MENEKIMSVVAYLGFWLSGIVILVLEKKNQFIRFHAMQSLLTFGGVTLFYIAIGIVPILGPIVAFVLSFLIWPIMFVLWLILIWKAYSGEKYKLPYVGDLAEKQLAKMK